MTLENERLYLEREKRVTDVIALRKPDRVPIATATEFFFTRAGGITDAVAMHDYDRMAEAWKLSTERFKWDMVPWMHAIRSGVMMEKLGVKFYKWPGYNLPENSYYQWVEAEYMLEDEYDALLKDPADFTIRTLMPRLSTVLEPLAKLPPIPWLANGLTLMTLLPAFAGSPVFQEVMAKLKEAGDEQVKWFQAQMRLKAELKEMGYPLFTYGAVFCAFDWISDCLRGMKGSMLDMYRRPEKLKAAVEYFTPITIAMAIAGARQAGIQRVFIPLHRGAAGFMNNKQFEEFYWPCLKKLLLALIDEGFTPVPFFEGEYTPRLGYLAELPKGKILGHFDKVDRKRCKEILGDVMCFWGNVPAGLLVTGTPAQVERDVIELIEIFGDNGGLIVDACTTGPPPESKVENVMAMTAAVFKYGKN